MFLSRIFLILFVTLGLAGCVGSDAETNPHSGNGSGNGGDTTAPDNGDGDNNTDDGGSNEDSGDNGGGNAGGGNNEGGGNNGTTPNPDSTLCALPDDTLTSYIYDGYIGNKDAYTLDEAYSPVNTISEDLSGTWVLVSESTDRTPSSARHVYSKSFFVIKENENESGKYLAANCRAVQDEPIETVVVWHNKKGEVVPERCYHFYLDAGPDEKPKVSNLAPEECKIRDSENNVIDLHDIHNPEAVKEVYVDKGRQKAPWNSGFINAPFLAQNNGSATIELPIHHPALLTEPENLKLELVGGTGGTHSQLEYTFNIDDSRHKLDSSFKAYKISESIASLGTSTMTLTSSSEVKDETGNENIVCVTQQFVIESQSCGTPNTVSYLTVSSATHHHQIASMEAQILADNTNVPDELKDIEELHIAITTDFSASDDSVKQFATASLMDEDTWYLHSQKGDMEFSADKINFGLTLSKEKPIDTSKNKVKYQFNVTLPNNWTW